MSDLRVGQTMWGGRFAKPPHAAVAAFNASVAYDKRLALDDITGSIAHAHALRDASVLTADECEQMVQGLEAVREEVASGQFQWREDLEDVHMNIEHRLTEKIGPLGGKLHTGRSRNDQVALDMHLYARAELIEIDSCLRTLQGVLCDLAEAHLDVIIPGFTHLQRAQPVLLSHHLLAYFWMCQRDRERVRDARDRADWMPLGAAALAGTTFDLDRARTADELGFLHLYENSMDAVSDRDYLIESLSVLAVIAMHLSRLAEEIILWNSTEFAWIQLDDAFATGSSIMPQKKNPDVAELTRGKAGRVFGHLLALLTTCKGLPLSYNKDMQEDKEGVFDAFDTVKTTLTLMAAMLSTTTFRRDRITAALAGDYSAATDLADYLVTKGVPFRQAHEVVGKIVRDCSERQRPFTDLTPEQLQSFSPVFGADALACLAPEAVVAARIVRGGTAPARVREQLVRARSALSEVL
ncbi:MAG: argininosuccinate lyase [Firmicutes bacterium]|nr:argininosuccinate lyase [Bacillota bacterium]